MYEKRQGTRIMQIQPTNDSNPIKPKKNIATNKAQETTKSNKKGCSNILPLRAARAMYAAAYKFVYPPLTQDDLSVILAFTQDKLWRNYLSRKIEGQSQGKISARTLLKLFKKPKLVKRTFDNPAHVGREINTKYKEHYKNAQVDFSNMDSLLERIESFVDMSELDDVMQIIRHAIEQKPAEPEPSRRRKKKKTSNKLSVQDRKALEGIQFKQTILQREKELATPLAQLGLSLKPEYTAELGILQYIYKEGDNDAQDIIQTIERNTGIEFSEEEIAEVLKNPREAQINYPILTDNQVEILEEYKEDFNEQTHIMNVCIKTLKKSCPNSPLFDTTRLDQAPKHFVSVHHYSDEEGAKSICKELRIRAHRESPAYNKLNADQDLDNYAKATKQNWRGTDISQASRSDSYFATRAEKFILGKTANYPIEIKVDPKKAFVVDMDQLDYDPSHYWDSAITLEDYMKLGANSQRFLNPEVLIPQDAEVYIGIRELPTLD